MKVTPRKKKVFVYYSGYHVLDKIGTNSLTNEEGAVLT